MRGRNGERVLVVAAHPDDEVLGAGGTIARHVDRGDRVTILICGEGITSRFDARGDTPVASLASLARDARAAATVLGVADLRFVGLPDNRFDDVPLLDVVKAIEEVKVDTRPTIVYTHHGGDLNIDHEVVHRATLTAFRPLPGEPLRELLAFEVASSTEWGPAAGAFTPNRYVAIDATLARKVRAMAAYRSEARAFPHPRSARAIRAKAAVRGSEAGLAAAEACAVVRSIVGATS
jgi:LmbE family N-acetylglucosaminyl deacetylase